MEKKRKNEKKRQNECQPLVFPSHKIFCHSQCVYKIWRLWLSWEPRNTWYGEKEKWTNKVKHMQRRLILFYTIQQVMSNSCTKFQILRCSSFEKKSLHTHTHIYGKDKNYIAGLYTSYTGDIKMLQAKWGYNPRLLNWVWMRGTGICQQFNASDMLLLNNALDN